jgi:hypothetical protein|tara:strand:- start:3143 stop:3802 length:660 start_codon:yes stop_codon:yes gene_type:complete
MPLPTPKNKEKKGDFVNRCMSDLSDKGEFDDNKQRAAVCYDIFKDSESKASIVAGEGDDKVLYFAESDERHVTKTKKQWDNIDKKELKRDTKKQKEKHEKDAVEDDKNKLQKLKKGEPSEKKKAEKKALKKDIKYDKKSEKTYAAERYGGKKRGDLKDSDFLDSKRRSFPVVSCQDVKDAVSSWGRYKGSMSFEQFKAKLKGRAKKLGCESSLPKAWKD